MYFVIMDRPKVAFKASDTAGTLDRLSRLRSRMTCSDAALIETYWGLHPRYRFIKATPRRAALLDIGAGSGGMAQWKRWGEPQREDIRFYGVDTTRGEHARLYKRWEALDLDAKLPRFRWVRFDACVMSHVIEHVRDPLRLLRWLGTRLRRGAPVYIEWPGAASLTQPPREALLPHGVDIMITNFFDDATHLCPIERCQLLDWLAEAGLVVRDSGTIDLGTVGEEMLLRGLRNGDAFMKLCGFWSATRWAEWVVAERP
jgi:SAM-dependent methyltransferase